MEDLRRLNIFGIYYMLYIRYVYSCGAFHLNLHPITSIRGEGFGMKKITPRIGAIGCKYAHPVTFIRGLVSVRIYILLRPFVVWFSIKFTSHYVYSWGSFGMEKTQNVNSYILLRLFAGWFSSKCTSYYVYTWDGFGMEKPTPE